MAEEEVLYRRTNWCRKVLMVRRSRLLPCWEEYVDVRIAAQLVLPTLELVCLLLAIAKHSEVEGHRERHLAAAAIVWRRLQLLEQEGPRE